MFSKPVAFLLALGTVTAAAGGAYIATRHNAADAPRSASVAVDPAPPAAPAAAQPVAETEAAVGSAKPAPAPAAEAPDVPERAPAPAPAAARRAAPDKTARVKTASEKTRTASSNGAPTSAHAGTTPVREPAVSTPPAEAAPPPAAAPSSAAPAPVDVPKPTESVPEVHAPQFEEVVLPAASVIGLQVETALSSERSRLEDRVEARVTRDVVANGRVAIPAGSRVLGSVTLVDRGGKLKDRARLGIRFHTVVLADGTDVPLQTEPFYRDGESPSGDSAKKIGGAAVGGAILGAILGGGKGAVIGGTTGAGAGTAAVMAGGRNPATVASGSIVSVRLSAPVSIQVEKREPQ